MRCNCSRSTAVRKPPASTNNDSRALTSYITQPSTVASPQRSFDGEAKANVSVDTKQVEVAVAGQYKSPTSSAKGALYAKVDGQQGTASVHAKVSTTC